MHFFSRMALGAGLLLLVTTCSRKSNYQAFTHDPLLYARTVKQLNNVVLENNFPPMVAARNYAYASIAGYECMAAGDPRFRSLSGQIRHLPPLPVPDTSEGPIDFPLAALLAFTKVGNAVTFPEGSLMEYHAQLLRQADSVGMPRAVRKRTEIFSDSIAAAILRWSRGDRYAETRGAEKYNVLHEPGRWVPTPPTYASAIEPHWGRIRPLVLDSASQFEIPRPPTVDLRNPNSVFYKALLEVKVTGDSLTDEQQQIAAFWDDNPFMMHVKGHLMFAIKKFSPPGHWLNIVGIAAQTAGADVGTTAAAYAHTSIAFFDAFIRGWEEKYRSNYVRPETVINQHLDESWRPFIQTPPFPSYVSGHATNSAAAAEVMTHWFGDNLSITDTSLVEFGIPARILPSFRRAAEEAALSRLYGGIHFRFDNDEGLKVGKQVGALVVERLQLKK
ncbi:MAG TPA: vanadium-dependent haloperoxidase [Lacibacter sp.]|nr:vanadium-dependent haloperoxidase [Lacibacter sp.]HMO88390.1 vanadium-dependent haloperoxidase [Lacibacter sp.]HMP87855.1 vanadium-dependent haloperoxidase [Lacibacter sp.]